MPGPLSPLAPVNRTRSIGRKGVRSPLCAPVAVVMQPLPDQMMRNGEGMGGKQAVGMLTLVHEREFSAVEPARILELEAIDDDVLADRARRAADHQRRRIGPGLRHVVFHVGDADAAFLENFAAYGV